jgi:hypothetical protein
MFIDGGAVMNSHLPADLLHLKKRFDRWRATRRHLREPIPEDLRRAVWEMRSVHSPALLRQVLRVDLRKLKRALDEPSISKPHQQPSPTPPVFFQLPAATVWPQAESSSSPAIAGCHLQFERPDGSRLTLTLPRLDPETINRLCADFLRA